MIESFQSKKDDLIKQLRHLGYKVFDFVKDENLRIMLNTNGGKTFGYILFYNEINDIKVEFIVAEFNELIIREM